MPPLDLEGVIAPAQGSYPAGFTFDPPERVAHWRPLVHWLLAIPHLAIVYVLGTVSEVVSVISWFAILFPGGCPPVWPPSK